MRTLRGTWSLVKVAYGADRRRLLAALLLMLLQAVALPLAAPAVGAFIDAVVGGDAHRATVLAVVIAGCVLASLTAGHFAHIFYYELGDLAVAKLEHELITLANASLGIEHHEHPEHADRMQVLRAETHRTGWTAMESVLSSAGLAAALVITSVLLAQLSPWLVALPLAALPPLFLGRRAEEILTAARNNAAVHERRARHMLGLATGPGPVQELRVCGLLDEVAARHTTAWNAASATLWKGEVRAAALRILGQLVFAVGYVLAVLLIVREAVAGHRTIGDVVLTITLAAQVNQQISTAVTLLQQLQRSARTMTDLEWLRRTVSAFRTVKGITPVPVPPVLRHGIRLDNVSFRYPHTGQSVLSNVSCTLPAGATVAVVGDNGAGKSTLVKLLCRMYEPSDGTVWVDNLDAGQLDLASWRERLAAGFQDFCRFELIAAQTVGVGDLPRIDSRPATTRALRDAGAADLLAQLDDGLETRIGTSYWAGTELSGGQWQKLALGRAMMRRQPLLLVLDEPAAALDARAEHALFERYAAQARRLRGESGTITVLVSHRFSTVRMADLILVVADGQVAESGTHDELMHRDGMYAELFHLQAAAYQ